MGGMPTYLQEKQVLNFIDGPSEGQVLITVENKNVATYMMVPVCRLAFGSLCPRSSHCPFIFLELLLFISTIIPNQFPSVLMHVPYQRPFVIDTETRLKCSRCQGAKGPGR